MIRLSTKTGKGSKKLSLIFSEIQQVLLRQYKVHLGPVAGRISAIGAIIGRVNPSMLVLTAGLVGVGLALTKFSKSNSANVEVQQVKLEALLKATGGAAGLTGRDIEDMAEAIGKGTLASVQGARDAAGVLLTFKSISWRNF